MLRTARTAHSAWRILLPEETLGRLKINPYGNNKLLSQQVTIMCIFLINNRQRQYCIRACYCLKGTQCLKEMNQKLSILQFCIKTDN